MLLYAVFVIVADLDTLSEMVDVNQLVEFILRALLARLNELVVEGFDLGITVGI